MTLVATESDNRLIDPSTPSTIAKMNIIIVPLDETYCDQLVTLEATCFGPDAWPREAFTELLQLYQDSPVFRGQVWGAINEHNQSVLGYVVLEVSSLGEAELSNLAVAPACRRQGVGRLLTSFVVGMCQEIGVQLLWLRVRVSNIPAVKFYEACGFAVRGEFRDYYAEPREDALILALEVPEGKEEDG